MAVASQACIVACAEGLWEACVKRVAMRVDKDLNVVVSVVWEPPQQAWFMLDTDAAVDEKRGMVNYGAVVRNYYGGWV